MSTEPMQADGKGTKGGDAIADQGGESDGNARNERDHARPKGGQGGFTGHGGQSEIAYHGGSDDEAAGDNHNAGAEGV